MAKIDFVFPINLNLAGKTCLVVGGNEAALRKIRSLLESGASVTVVAPKVIHEIETLNRMKLLRWKKKPFSRQDLNSTFIVFSATGDAAVDRKVAAEANKKHLFINVADNGQLSSFISPAIIRRGNLMFAVSTGGQTASLATAIQRELETRYGREYAKFLKLLGEIRGDVPEKILDSEKSKEMVKKLTQPDLMELQSRRNLSQFMTEIKKILNL
jgi:precorrin-2 dehydrogenase / sirohydrochlorin ferrochelatase